MVKHQENKYYLKTLHEEIDLFDRKLAHLMKYDSFESDEDRDAAAQKMSAKRATLAETARRLAADGVEFKETELPRSFRPKDAPAPVRAAEPEPVPVVVVSEARNARGVRQASAFAGTSLDWERSVREYMLKKGRK